MRHSSASYVNEAGLKVSNERLEYLGDAILDAIIAEYLFDEFEKRQEGELTKMKAKVVSRKNLNEIGLSLNIEKVLVCNMGKQELHHSILGNAFEALVGAIYLDKGYQKSQKIVLRILQKNGLDRIVHADVDFKSKLHEWSQKKKKKIDFRVIEEKPEQSSTKYHMALYINDHKESEGKGSSKKIAEQKAAERACKALELL